MVIVIECETHRPAVLTLLLGQSDAQNVFLRAEVGLSGSPNGYFLLLFG